MTSACADALSSHAQGKQTYDQLLPKARQQQRGKELRFLPHQSVPGCSPPDTFAAFLLESSKRVDQGSTASWLRLVMTKAHI
jgi:hypothetical protein